MDGWALSLDLCILGAIGGILELHWLHRDGGNAATCDILRCIWIPQKDTILYSFFNVARPSGSASHPEKFSSNQSGTQETCLLRR